MKIESTDVGFLKRARDLLDNPRMATYGKLPTDPDKLEKFISSDCWPKAVHDSAIVRTEEEMTLRAKSILRQYIKVKDKKFLDFGCGFGHCVREAKNDAKYALGFDVNKQEKWEEMDAEFTDDFNRVKHHGPFDVILLYDVIDHVHEMVHGQIMSQVRQVSNKNTVIHIRCHPWTSIHGGHLYENLNRAFAHLFLNDEQISKHQSESTCRVTRPIATYRDIFNGRGLRVDHHRVHKINWNGRVGKFFSQDDIVQALTKSLGNNKEWQDSVLPIEFVDYVCRVR